MKVKIAKVTDKGQLSLPVSMQQELGIKKGDELLLIQDGKRIIMEKITEDDFRDLRVHGEKVFEELWDNVHDEHWDKV